MVRGAGIWAGLDGGVMPDNVMIDSSTFTGNSVTSDDFISGGGAIYAQGDPGSNPIVYVRNSAFTANSAINDAGGGAIEIVNGVDLQVFNSDFFSNQSANSGGAINVTRTVVRDTIDNVPLAYYNTNDEPLLAVDRSLFVINTAASQGGAINLFQHLH